MTRNARIGLWVAAGAFLLWEAFGAARWVGAAGGIGVAFGHLWRTIRSDWMALVVVTDHLVIAACALLWMWRDAAGRGWPAGRPLGWAALFVALGWPRLLAFLPQRGARAQAAATEEP